MTRMTARAGVDLPLPADQAWRLAKRTATQLYLSKSVFGYGGELPPVREEGYEATHRLLLWGAIPAWNHWQRFERVDETTREIVLHERGGPYKRWIHHQRIDEAGDERSRFDESIEFDAGLLTPIIWIGAQLLCRSRVRRFSELARIISPD